LVHWRARFANDRARQQLARRRPPVALSSATSSSTEGRGFGAGTNGGWRSFMDIVCRASATSLRGAVVLVATVKAPLKHHGGNPEGGRGGDRRRLGEPHAPSRHHPRGSAFNAVVAVNRFPADTDAEIGQIREESVRARERRPSRREANEAIGQGRVEGATALAEGRGGRDRRAVELCARSTRFDDTIRTEESRRS